MACRVILMRYLWLVLGSVSVALFGCVSTEYINRSTEERRPTNADSIIVFKSEKEFDTCSRPFEIIGEVTSAGNFLSSKGSMRNSIVRMAAQKGADAVVFVFIKDIKASLGSSPMMPVGGWTNPDPARGRKRVSAYLLKFK